MISINRRNAVKAFTYFGASLALQLPSNANAKPNINLLDPAKLKDEIKKFKTDPKVISLTGRCVGHVSYYIAGNGDRTKQTILYFHGTGGNFQSAAPPEYPLFQDFNVIFVNRPGYSKTDGRWIIEGREVKAPTPSDTAKIAAELLKVIPDVDTSRVHVMGVSGGAPAAFAFAAANHDRTRSLIIQAGFTHPWKDENSLCFVPTALRDVFVTAIGSSHDYEKQTANLGAGYLGLAKNSHDFWMLALIGSRLNEVRQDPAFKELTDLEVPWPTKKLEDALGLANDFYAIFRLRDEICDWKAVKAPTLIIHDADDPFVGYTHARFAADRISNPTLKSYRLGGHMIWLGPDAMHMHNDRIQFLKGNQA